MSQVTQTQDWNPDDAKLAELIENITRRLQAGEKVDEQEIEREHPEYAEQIAQLLPTLRLMGAAGDDSVTGVQWRRQTTALEGAPHVLGDFRIIRELGRGAMGIVYEAQQVSLDKRVALKILPYARMLDQRSLKRFEVESRAAAQLQHPNIVSVYAVGCEHNTHYYAMQYVEGTDLAHLIKHLKQETEVPAAATTIAARARRVETSDNVDRSGSREDCDSTAEAVRGDLFGVRSTHSASNPRYYEAFARAGIDVAAGLQHAHDMGVVHRDIKPANLLVDKDGNVLITDFGLAQVQGAPGMTRTGDLVGTLRYMSPEQTLARRIVVDHRTDIYALGITLYELLTLHRAFDAETKGELLRQIAFEEPRKPKKLNPRIPTELETIVLTAIAKNPDERYQTARELAEDLKRFLEDEPILARPMSLVQRSGKWIRRHKALVASAAAMLTAVLIAAVSLSFTLYGALQDEAAEKEIYRKLWMKAEGLRIATIASLHKSTNPGLAMRLGIIAAELHPSREANNVLQQASDANHEYLVISADNRYGTTHFQPSGKRLVATAPFTSFQRDPRPAQVFDITNPARPTFVELFVNTEDARVNPRVTSAVFSPDGRRILTASSAEVLFATDDQKDGTFNSLSPILWESSGESPIELGDGAFLFHAHESSFSPSSLMVVTPAVGNVARVYDVVGGKPLFTLAGHSERVIHAAFSRNESHIVTVSDDDTVGIWDTTIPPSRVASALRTIAFRATTPIPGPTITSAVLSPDGQSLLVSTKDLRISLHKWQDEADQPLTWSGGGARFSLDGKWIAYQYGRSTVVRTANGVVTNREFDGDFEDLAPNGKLVATSKENVVFVWDVPSGHLLAACHGHESVVRDVVFSANSSQLASVDRSGTIRVWNVRSGAESSYFDVQPGGETNTVLALSRDSQRLLVSREPAHMTTSFELATWTKQHSVTGLLSDDASASTERFVTVAGTVATVHFYAAGQSSIDFLSPSGERLLDAVLSPSGRFALVHDMKGQAWFWHVDGNATRTLKTGDGFINDITFHPSSDQAATASNDGVLRIWDASSGELIRSLDHPGEDVVNVEYSPDGDTLATVSDSNTARLWQTDNGQLKATLRLEGAAFQKAKFTSGSRYVLTYHPWLKSAVHCWTGEGQYKFSSPPGEQIHVALHPELPRAAIAGEEGLVLWNLDDGKVRCLTDSPVSVSAFNRDGTQLVTVRPVQDTAPHRLEEGQLNWFRGPVAQIWDVESGETIGRLDSVNSNVISIVPNLAAGLLLVSERVYGASVFDVENHKARWHVPGHGAPLSFGAVLDSGRAVTASWDHNAVIWNEDGERTTLSWHESAITSAAVSPDQTWLLTGDADGKVALWAVKDGIRHYEGSIKQHAERVTFCCFDNEGERFLTAGLEGSVHIFSIKSGILSVFEQPQNYVAHAEFAPRGAGFAIVLRPQMPQTSKGDGPPPVKLYPSITKQPLLLSRDSPAIWAAYASGGQTFVTGSSSFASVWDATSGKHLRRLDYGGRRPRSFSVHAPSGLLLTQFEDSITLWDTTTGVAWLSIPVGMSGMAGENAVLSPDGQRIIASIGRRIRSFPVNTLDHARRVAPRELTERERRLFQIPMQMQAPDSSSAKEPKGV